MTSLNELREDYKRLTNYILPDMAEAHTWPVRFNHCFQRILLDHIFGGCWYHFLDKKNSLPAYKQLNEIQLRKILDTGQLILSDPSLLVTLNKESLGYRKL